MEDVSLHYWPKSYEDALAHQGDVIALGLHSHPGDVCTCRYTFPCSRCGAEITDTGEDLAARPTTVGGLCDNCAANGEVRA